MSSRTRILSFGTAGVVTVAGLAAAVAGGLVGQVLAIALISLGLGGALLLIFFEVGLSEDRARAREQERRRTRDAEGARRPAPDGLSFRSSTPARTNAEARNFHRDPADRIAKRRRP